MKDCLTALTRLDYPTEQFKVVVVDDGSPTPVQSVVDEFKHLMNVVTIRQENAGPAAARNKGALAAEGTHIIFTDDDCGLASDYLSQLEKLVQNEPLAIIGGHTINALPDNQYAMASQLLIDYLYDYFNKNPARTKLFTSNNLIVPTDLFNRTKGFDTLFPLAAGEDRELCDRFQQEGRKMIYASELIVYHSHSMTLRTFWRQHFNYGRGAYRYHWLRSNRVQGHIKPEPLSFYFKLLGYPFRQGYRWRSGVYLGLLIISQLANALGFITSKIRIKHPWHLINHSWNFKSNPEQWGFPDNRSLEIAGISFPSLQLLGQFWLFIIG